MSEWLMNLIDWKTHGPLGAAIAAIAYVGNRHIKLDQAREERLRELEVDRVRKQDVERMYDRMDKGFQELREAQTEILTRLGKP